MCIFCKIIKNEIPSYKVYEDEDTIAILDISQATYGHTLVMPKKHIKNVLECDEQTYLKTMKTVKYVSDKLYSCFDANGMNIISNCNAIAGQSVDHMHYHIIFRYDAKDCFNIDCKSNEYNLDEIISKIKNI